MPKKSLFENKLSAAVSKIGFMKSNMSKASKSKRKGGESASARNSKITDVKEIREEKVKEKQKRLKHSL